MLNVRLIVPPVVNREFSPKLLLNTNAPSPPTVFFTTVIDPGCGGTLVLMNVQVVVAPENTVTAAGVPLVQLLVWLQPASGVSLTL